MTGSGPTTEAVGRWSTEGDAGQADQAQQEPPNHADPERDSNLRAKFGLEPKDLRAELAGGKRPGR